MGTPTTDDRNTRNGAHHEKESKRNGTPITPPFGCIVSSLTVQRTIGNDKPVAEETLHDHIAVYYVHLVDLASFFQRESSLKRNSIFSSILSFGSQLS